MNFTPQGPVFWNLRTICLALAICLLAVSLCEACPTCKDGLASNDPARANMVRGYFWSILFMMSMPFLIFGGWGIYFYRVMRQQARQNANRLEPIAIGRVEQRV